MALDVVARRPDGYHDLRSVMQSVTLHDKLLIKRMDKSRYDYKLVCEPNRLPTDDRNLVTKAVRLLSDTYGLPGGVFIELKKRIPVAAGLAGGSSDCAAALVGLRRLFGLPISNDELLALGKQLGADVPFCIMRGTYLAEGIGDRLTKLPPHPPGIYIVLARPPVYVSTKDVFKQLDVNAIKDRPDVDLIIRSLNDGGQTGLTAGFGNVLEPVTTAMHPVISQMRTALLSYGAITAMMSGSGPSVFGYFCDKTAAITAMRQLRQDFPSLREVFVTQPYVPGCVTAGRALKR